MISRRGFLTGGAAVAALLTACSSSGSAAPSSHDPSSHDPNSHDPSSHNDGVKPTKHAYGSDAAQFGELSRPATTRHRGTVVLVHGGFWLSQYDLSLGRPLAADLAARGWTVWNLEYRRVGDGGGWPATFDDIAAGVDHLGALDVDTSAVVAVGHSAGGQLAAWAAGRSKLPAGDPGASPKVPVTGVVSQAGVLDLAQAARAGVGGSAAPDLMGGSPEQVPQRYRIGDPVQAVPIGAPVLCVHSRADQNVPYAQSTAYVAAARKAGGQAALHTVDGDHFTLIDPSSAAWAVVVEALPSLAAGRLP